MNGTPSQSLLKMNLQLFAEEATPSDTPASDPTDSYNSDLATPEDTPTPDETEPEKADPTPETTPDTARADPEPPKLKIKFNHEEKEITLDEARELSQKGLNYDKAVEKAKQEARDAYIAEQGWVGFDGKAITTEAQYKQALDEQKMREKYKELPPEVQDELIKSKQFREQQTQKEEDQKQKEVEAKAKETQQKDQIDFLTWFKEQNNRDFDDKKDTIPPEVWQENANGVPLIAAYSKHENATLRERIKALEHNAEVGGHAPVGSVTEHGSTEVAEKDPFLIGFNSVK